MRDSPLLRRLVSLARQPVAGPLLGLLALAVTGLAFLPAAGIPGYAHALLLTVILGLGGLWVGVAAVGLERRIDDPRPWPGVPWDLRTPGTPGRRVALVFGVAAIWLLGLAGLGLAAAGLGGALRGTCDLGADLIWYPLLSLPTAGLAAATGVLVGVATRRRWSAGLLGVALLLVSAAASAWPILTGPQVFGFNHFLGWVPGPLWDERATVEAPLLWFRLQTLAWSLAALGGAALLVRRGSMRPGPPALARLGPAALLAVGIGAALVLEGSAPALGFRQSFASVADALGGEARAPGLVLHYPREREPEWVEAALLDHRFRLAQVTGWLDLDPDALPVVHSYLFRSEAEKRRLTGAGRTSVAKPWLSAIFLDDRGLPHPVLKHELAHVVAAPLGRGPFRVATSDGLIPNDGLVEGLAVAADWRPGALGVHGEARAMRALGVAPPAEALFQRAAFWRQAPARAYTLAGSFLRWLADTRGVEALKAAYRAGSLSAVGDPAALVEAWTRFLDAEPVPPEALRLAEARFRRPPVVHRACAFDVTRAREAAREARRAGRLEEALGWLGTAARLEPGDPAHAAARLPLLRELGRTAEAEALTGRLLAHPSADAALRSRLLLDQGDAAWAAGDLEAARTRFEAVLALGADRDRVRAAAARLQALEAPDRGAGLRGYLAGELAGVLGPLRLRERLLAWPDEPLTAYLLGRRLLQAGDPPGAMRWLARARDLGLPALGGLAVENLRLLALAARDAGESETAARVLAELAGHPAAGEADRLLARDLAERLAFETRLAGRSAGGRAVLDGPGPFD